MSPGLCAVCRREPRGFGWFDAGFKVSRPPSRPHPPPALQPDLPGHLPSETRHDRPDPQRASRHGGRRRRRRRIPRSPGKSDLATLSPAEWRQLIEIVVTGYCDTLRELAGQDRDRLDGMAERIPF